MTISEIRSPAGSQKLALVAFDISSLRAIQDNEEERHSFTTPQDAYHVLSYELPRRILALTQEVYDPDNVLRNASIASLYDIYLDLMRLGRALTDIAYAKTAGAQPIFNDSESPILSYLMSDATDSPRSVSSILPLKRGRLSHSRSLKDRLRALKRLALLVTIPRQNRLDVMGRGGLVEQYLECEKGRAANIDPYLLNWPNPETVPTTVQNVTEALCEIFDDITSTHHDVVPSAGKKASSAARILVRDWLSRSYASARFLSQSALRHYHGTILIGAAPKTLGRLLASFYQSHGARVLRCAHGGERAFFDDYHWGLSELPFCDEYLTHGTGEAKAISQRSQEGRILKINSTSPKFTAIGSTRHQSIFKSAHSRNHRTSSTSRSPRVMFVASSYLTEDAAHLPAIKPCDVQLADLHGFLLRILSSLDCEVLFKPHPKGRIHPADLFDGHYDKLVTGSFDPVSYNVDLYIFDYAGSAFFDSLATAKGVILLDTGLRPFDPVTLPDLKSRCFIIRATLDEKNQFYIDRDLLSRTIFDAYATDCCPEAFAKKYFSPLSTE